MKKTILLGILLSTTLTSVSLGISADPKPFSRSQSDGSKIDLHIRGDEFYNWLEDTDGYTVVKDKGNYVYAVLDSDARLSPTRHHVGKVSPRSIGLTRRILPSKSVIQSAASFQPMLSSPEESISMVPPSGTVKNLVILCKFSDHVTGTHTRIQADYDTIFNDIDGDPTLAPTGSVKDYYLENSYGTMTLQSTVLAWVTLPQTEAYYADGQDGLGSYPQNAQGMVEDALDLVDSMVDFGDFDTDNDGFIDAITFIHSGYGAETGGGGGDWIWSHRWSLWALSGGEWTSNDRNGLNQYVQVYDYHTEPALWGTSGTGILRIGVICHEMGHFFGLPDLYDTDQSSEGIGSYGLMANSWGFDYSQLHPPHFSAYSKIFLDWVTPTVISSLGPYSIPQVETNATIYKITDGYPSGEYLLIENRQPAGFESIIPQGGLAVWHIDENKTDNTDEGYPGQSGWPTNNNHYMVALLQADGDYDMERGNNRGDSGDLYHQSGVSSIGPDTVPNTDTYQSGIVSVTDNLITNIGPSGSTMSFSFGDGVPEIPVAVDDDIEVQIDTPTTISLIATDDGLPDPPGALDIIITTLPVNGTLSDPAASEITAVPYTLVSNGNQVLYTPDSSYAGSDGFQFKANDGDSDSNTATISITVSETVTYLYEDFEAAFVSGAPVGWSKEFKTLSLDWVREAGDHSDDVTYEGSYNAMLYYASSSDHETYLVTPEIDFAPGVANASLEFWHRQGYWSPDQDTLEVYYKTSSGGAWTLIASYTSDVTTWTQRTLSLPNTTSTYYIGFLGNAKYGYGVCIDAVTVTGEEVPPDPDIDGDGKINMIDLSILNANWLLTWCTDPEYCQNADINRDGTVDIDDLLRIAVDWLE